jgi:Acetyltransferase (GNAT) domain
MPMADGGRRTADGGGAGKAEMTEMTEPGRFDTVRTDRLVMRRWLDSDREPFAALNADPETLLFFPQTLNREASDRLVDLIEERFDQQGYGLWALEVADTGEFIGFTGLNPMPDGVPAASRWAGGSPGMPGITATPRRRPGPHSGWPSTASAWTRSGRWPLCSTSRPRRSCGAWG